MQKPKFIIFDCDGVLIDSEILANRVECSIKNQLGFPITIEEQITKFAGCGMNHPLMIEELARLPKNYWQMVDEECHKIYAAELKAIPGVIETLKTLTLPKCVASSSEAASLEKKLKLTELNQFFSPDSVFHGKLVPRMKPEPDLFFYACEKMGWVPEDCLVVEDSVPGVKAGKAAGMRVCGFLGGQHIYPGHSELLLEAGADELISDMREVLRVIG